MDDAQNPEPPAEANPDWQPIGRDERRVLGVLVEKAKTTPEAYPLTLNSLTNGCNQKNNRYPKLDLEPVDVQNAIANLVPMGAVAELPSGRVEKFRHFVTDWMGVSSVECAVMAELLLRGAQSVGDLRGRANRMSPIASVAELRPIVHSLMHKGLVVPLTDAGRGQIVTHNLYADPEELSDLRREFNGGVEVKVADQPKPKSASSDTSGSAPEAPTPSPPPASSEPFTGESPKVIPALQPSSSSSSSSPPNHSDSEIDAMKQEIADLKSEIAKLKSEVEDLWSNIG